MTQRQKGALYMILSALCFASMQVVVLSGGIVAEQGSPAELYARKGLYAHMVDLQSASQNWTI